MHIRHLVKSSLILLSVITASTLVHAELIDNSKTVTMTEEQLKEYYAHTFATRNVSWKVMPNFKIPSNLYRRFRGGKYELILQSKVDKQGDIIDVKILKSSGEPKLDKAAMFAIKKARLYPFIKEGVPVPGIFVLPIEYNLNNSCH